MVNFESILNGLLKTNNTLKRISAIITMILGAASISLGAQTLEASQHMVSFRPDSSRINPAYRDNARAIANIASTLQAVKDDSLRTLRHITFYGVASPEGSYSRNYQLSRQRITAMRDLFRQYIVIPDSIVTLKDDYISWGHLSNLVANSDMANRNEVVRIIDSDSSLTAYAGRGGTIDRRVPALQAIDGGRTWQELKQRFFPLMRRAGALMVVERKPATQVIPVRASKPDTLKSEPLPVPSIVPVPVPEPTPEPAPVEADEWNPAIYVKTNAVGWAMLISNAGVEWEFSPRWSAALSVYYSALNYFKLTRKFRTLAIMPEIRLWLNGGKKTRVWVDAHLGLAYYNYAKCGEWRYQDHDGRTPALGGGLGLGLRTPLGHSGHWFFETSVGAGVYRLHYDIFHNERNGQLAGERRRTFYGLDRVALSIAYKFNLNRHK